MNYTEKYHLPQWEEADRVMRTDFNNAMSALDEGLAQAQETADGAAVPALVTGTYRGTKSPIKITLGFRPSAVLIYREYNGYDDTEAVGCCILCVANSASPIAMEDDGFTIRSYSSKYPAHNWGNTDYRYIAFR